MIKTAFLLLTLVAVFQGIKAADPACLQPIQAGRCLAYMERYAYTEGKGCEMFVYGGCGGNENRFMTYEDCKNKCLDQ